MAGRTTRPAATSCPASIIRSSSRTRRGRSRVARFDLTGTRDGDGSTAERLRRRDALRVLAACMADWWLPRRAARAAPRARSARPERRVIVVTFGGGVRYEDTLAPRRLDQHPAPRHRAGPAGARLSGRALRRADRTLQLDRRAGHRLPPERRRLRQRSAGHADDLRAAPQGTRAAAGRSLGDRDQQELRPDGRQQAARVRRSVSPRT